MRYLSFISVALVALYLPFWVFVVAASIYALFFRAFDIFFIAVLIDAEFGNRGHGIWYVYTFATFVTAVAMIYIKPRLRFY